MDVVPITKRVLHPGEVVDELRPPVDVFGERLQQVAQPLARDARRVRSLFVLEGLHARQSS